jgi:hypothetical protein
MATRTVGIILNGATSRIGSTQHLKNALAPIRAEGGLIVGADRVMPIGSAHLGASMASRARPTSTPRWPIPPTRCCSTPQ